MATTVNSRNTDYVVPGLVELLPAIPAAAVWMNSVSGY